VEVEEKKFEQKSWVEIRTVTPGAKSGKRVRVTRHRNCFHFYDSERLVDLAIASMALSQTEAIEQRPLCESMSKI
jgi:hypothetical protein